jgi:hypothetical protein
MAHVRACLRLGPETTSPQLFVAEEGIGLSYWGGRMIWRRIRQRSRVKRLGSHVVRRTSRVQGLRDRDSNLGTYRLTA